MKKLLAFGLCFTMLVFCLLGCSATQHDDIYSDDERIAIANSCVTLTSIGSKIEEHSYQYSAQSLSGAITLWHYQAESDAPVTLSCSISVSNAGKAKLVLVAPDKTVVTLVEASGQGEDSLEDYTFEPMDGIYKVKVVGAGQPKIAAQFDFSHGIWGDVA